MNNKKNILIVMEGFYPGHSPSKFLKEMLEEEGHNVTTCETIAGGFDHLGDDRNKYDLVILDPLNSTIMQKSTMCDPCKIAALGVLARAKGGGAKTIVQVDPEFIYDYYDKASLRANADEVVKNGDFEGMMGAIQSALSEKQLA